MGLRLPCKDSFLTSLFKNVQPSGRQVGERISFAAELQLSIQLFFYQHLSLRFL